MKIAVTSSTEGVQSPIDPRFGRAGYFVLYEKDSGEITACEKNFKMDSAQGAGIQAAEQLAGLDVDAVVTGHCGPKAFTVLTAAGIGVYPCAGCTVEEALALYRNGTLEHMESADVEGHWA